MQHSNKHTPMEVNNKYIRFDWAVKRMLRDKANFAVLEGLITVLTGEVALIQPRPCCALLFFSLCGLPKN